VGAPESPVPSPGANPFLPDEIARASAERQRAYALHLLDVRDRLEEAAASRSGGSLEAVIAEVDAALVLLREGMSR
jgi:hypothetical protein